MTTCVTAGVGGGGLALWLGFQKPGKKIQTTPRDNNADVFSWKSWEKKRKFRKLTSPIRTALSPKIDGMSFLFLAICVLDGSLASLQQ